MNYDAHPVKMNCRLIQEFGYKWNYVRETKLDNVVYYVACDICRMLKLPSTSYYVRNFVNDENKLMCQLDDVNVMRRVHLVTYEGLLRLIKYGKSPECRILRNKLYPLTFVPRVKYTAIVPSITQSDIVEVGACTGNECLTV